MSELVVQGEMISPGRVVGIVCHDAEVEKFVQIIQESGHMGESGDGRIFVSGIEEAVNIRTGEEGDDAL